MRGWHVSFTRPVARGYVARGIRDTGYGLRVAVTGLGNNGICARLRTTCAVDRPGSVDSSCHAGAIPVFDGRTHTSNAPAVAGGI